MLVNYAKLAFIYDMRKKERIGCIKVCNGCTLSLPCVWKVLNLHEKTKAMGKRVRISNCSLNSYGTRVMTSGMDVAQYQRNPVLLYMHQRGNVIGYVKDLKVEGEDVTGELMFDEATDLSKQCKKQYEFGSLKMVSVGIDIMETSEDKAVLVQGQTSPTITKCKLFEVSLVDIGSNDDAIVMMRDGIKIELGKGGENALPLLHNIKNRKTMDQKIIALQLGLPETATEEEIKAKLEELKAAKEQVAALTKEKETLTLAAITQAVDVAITEKRIGADRKEQFVNLGKSVGVEELKKTFEAMNPQVKLTTVMGHQGGAPTVGTPATYKKLSEVPESELEELRSKHPDTYKQLYKAEYGMECEL